MSTLLLILIVLLFCGGLVGTIIPALPGVGLIYLGILLYAVSNNFADISLTAVIVFGVVALLAGTASYFGSAVGAKKGGGGKKAFWGALLGAAVGLFVLPPIGLFVGAFVGTLIGALLEGNSPDKAMRVAFLSVAGIIGGSLVQLLLSLALIIAFLLVIVL